MNTIFIVLPILTILMFQLGLNIDAQSFVRVFRKPLPIVIGLTGQLLLLPVVAFVIAIFFKLEPVYFIGLILIACCPGGSSSNVFSMLAKGNVALSITLTALSSIITTFTIPLIMQFTTDYISAYTDTTVSLPVGKLIMQNIVLMFVPILLGFFVRKRWSECAELLSHRIGRFAFPALMLLAAVFFVANYQAIINNILLLGLCVSLLIISCISLGTLLSRGVRLELAERRTITIEIGMQNAAQAIAIATSPFIFDDEAMAIPGIIYALMMNVILLTYLKVIKK